MLFILAKADEAQVWSITTARAVKITNDPSVSRRDIPCRVFCSPVQSSIARSFNLNSLGAGERRFMGMLGMHSGSLSAMVDKASAELLDFGWPNGYTGERAANR